MNISTLFSNNTNPISNMTACQQNSDTCGMAGFSLFGLIFAATLIIPLSTLAIYWCCCHRRQPAAGVNAHLLNNNNGVEAELAAGSYQAASAG